jgi:hypothetical protein
MTSNSSSLGPPMKAARAESVTSAPRRYFPDRKRLFSGPHGTSALLAQVLIVLAYRYASSVKLGPFIYSTIVFTALIDWVVWHHPPTLFVVVGMVLVIGGGLVAIRGRSEAPLVSIES